MATHAATPAKRKIAVRYPKVSDLEAAAAARVKRWLVRTGKGAQTEASLKAQGRHTLYDAVFEDLADAVAELVDRRAST